MKTSFVVFGHVFFLSSPFHLGSFVVAVSSHYKFISADFHPKTSSYTITARFIPMSGTANNRAASTHVSMERRETLTSHQCPHSADEVHELHFYRHVCLPTACTSISPVVRLCEALWARLRLLCRPADCVSHDRKRPATYTQHHVYGENQKFPHEIGQVQHTTRIIKPTRTPR